MFDAEKSPIFTYCSLSTSTKAQRDVNSLTQGDELREVLLALFLATGTWLGVW
jgi:hypothetical protein